MKDMPRISESEYEIMKLIWDEAPISTNDVVKRFEGINDWSPKTVQTLLARLVKKGALGYEKKGRVYIYTPLIKEEEYIHSESSSFLKKFFDGALNSMVLNFIDDEKLTDQDINELIRILEKGRKESR